MLSLYIIIIIHCYFVLHRQLSFYIHTIFQNQDGSTTTFNEYDVETDDAFHNNNHNNNNNHHHHQKSNSINSRTPTLTNSTTNTKKVSTTTTPNNNNNNTQNSIPSNQSLSPRLESPLYVFVTKK